MKKLLILLLISSLSIFTTISCTSSDDAADGEEISDADGVEEGSELDNIDDAELDGEAVAEDGEAVAEDGDAAASEDDLLMDEGSEEVADGDTGDGTELTDDGASDDTTTADSDFSEDDSTGAAAGADSGSISDISGGESTDSSMSDTSVADVSEPLTDDTDATPGFSETDSSSSIAAPTEDIARTWVPVKKIASAPFNQGGQLLNTVYIVRPGDTLESASQKIFGSNRSSEILAANPHLNRSFTTGDKLYYNSPNRSGDNAQMLTYYEDVGMPAQTYVTQDGDNIRTLGKTLLGDANSWKELWATNAAIDSKDQLPGGTEIRYFPEGGVAAPPSQPVAENIPPPQPPEETAMNDIPPPPDMGASGTMEPPPPPPSMEPPPPPPPVAMEPPPPPVETKVAKKDAVGGMNMKLILAACLLIGGGLAIVILQKSKSKKINIGETQI